LTTKCNQQTSPHTPSQNESRALKTKPRIQIIIPVEEKNCGEGVGGANCVTAEGFDYFRNYAFITLTRKHCSTMYWSISDNALIAITR